MPIQARQQKSVWEPHQKAMQLAIPLLLRKKQDEQELNYKNQLLELKRQEIAADATESARKLIDDARKSQAKLLTDLYKDAVEGGQQGAANQIGPQLEALIGTTLPSRQDPTQQPFPASVQPQLKNYLVEPQEGSEDEFVSTPFGILNKRTGKITSKGLGRIDGGKGGVGGLLLGRGPTQAPTEPPTEAPSGGFQVTPEIALAGTGPGASVKEKINNLFGWMTKGIIFEETAEARQTLGLFQQHVMSGLVNNPRFPVAEQTVVRRRLADMDKFFKDPDNSLKDLEKLKTFLETKRNEKQQAVSGGRITEKQAKDYLGQINDIESILSMMTTIGQKAPIVDVSKMTDAELDAIISGS